jgi:tetratricopeptide (TPR) repeat protein
MDSMVHHRRVALLLLPFLCLQVFQAVAQLQTGDIRVYVTYPDDRATSGQVKVGLISGSNGNQIGETYTNDHGRAQFLNVTLGNYHVLVSGQNIQTTESETFEVDARTATQSIFVRVRPAAENDRPNATRPGSATVSASDLMVSKKASQEFDKATKLIAKQEWKKAIDQLHKALALYPAYAEAYNNLGVVYARLGDSVKEREALQKAIAVNDHFAPAFVNLARLEMKEHNFAAAEADLNKATSADPADARTLALLAQAQLLDVHYEDAITSAHKVHSMSHAPYALVHYIAARACERLNRLSDAVSELKLFLTEEPSGESATVARQEMAAIEKHLP